MNNFYFVFMANVFESYDDMVNEIKLEGDDFLVSNWVNDKSALISLTKIIDAGFEVHHIFVNDKFYYYCLCGDRYMIFLIKEV